MADGLTEPPDDAPDHTEVELVAYLDGELDAAAARRVEARIAADPKLRARAEALKRSYDLLDFLPKPEPSAAFTSRTLDRLPAVKSSPAAPPVQPTEPVPVAHPSGTGTPILTPVPPPRTGTWALVLVLLIGVSLGVGYLGTAAARTYLFPPPAPLDVTADTLPLADYRVVERLALYAPADDLEFVERLAAHDRFGDDVGLQSAAPVEPDKPDGKELDALVRAFRELPPDRQDKLRQLDHQLHDLPDARRDTLLRVLEVYAAWLQRLPDADRKKILAAPSPGDRLEAIDDTRSTQWVAGLPAAQRQKLKTMPPVERGETIVKWKAEEDTNRDRWNTARFHHEFVRSGRQPWPFTDETLKKQVLDFAQSAYHPGDPKKNRLLPADRTRFTEALERGEKGGEWAWLGKTVYDISRNPRYETYPEAGPNGKMTTDFADLPPLLRDVMTKRIVNKAGAEVVGRWPDFALEVNRGMSKSKFAGKEFHLGPARPGEFRPEVEQFLPALQKMVTPAEWAGLAEKAGRWPEYPAELLRLARAHDLSVPGAMPPGPPSQWEKTYSLPPRPVPRPGSE
ncbi:anti-sigma factor [Urbifossiella limnaea]|uniref:Zinc-finger domain-containing protein n=1 Tax=Urbifossiella limnaea TaxID=2528023 RepID=A0A517XSK5_9BACT|nr:hypothetical protein [Urbifossiella limnaea]QDU20489.1 hypothetical protein ETAA1_24410 [Urbifossiella limnaea]